MCVMHPIGERERERVSVGWRLPVCRDTERSNERIVLTVAERLVCGNVKAVK